MGLTRLAAFDDALMAAGVGDFNLVRLSSVIPPGARLEKVAAADQISGEHGDLLFCVYADAYASTPGEEAWAGVSWAQREDGSGGGLFVEHGGASRASVERDLRHSLEAISDRRRLGYRPGGQVVASAVCRDHPVCAVVMATYRRMSWATQWNDEDSL